MESDLERIVRSRQQLTDQHFQYFLYQILRGVKYFHSANVLHRDLKPSNLLVNGNCDLAVCDFGLARGFEVEGEDTLTAYVVTRWYRSPEILCNSPYYGKGADIWSIGCIFAELLTHEPFFRGDNPQHQLEVIVSKVGCPDRSRLSFVHSPHAMQSLLQFHFLIQQQAVQRGLPAGVNYRPHFASFFPQNKCSPEALHLLQRMLEFHPDDRITVEEALSHPYLREFQGQMPEPNCKELFNFDFEEDIRGTGDEARQAVRYFIYDEMRLYRPSAPKFAAPILGMGVKSFGSSTNSEKTAFGCKYNDRESEKEGSYQDDEMVMLTAREGGANNDSLRGKRQ